MKRIFSLLLTICLALFLFSCAIKDPGTRTVNYGADGLTITSETIAAGTSDLVEIEKEKSVQQCWKEQGKVGKQLETALAGNPFAVAMWEQAKALNNALSLMRTGKNYNPCPSSTNSMDADIAESEMYKSIYHDVIGGLKFLGGVWGGVELADTLVSGLAKAGTTALAANDGSSIVLNDSLNKVAFGERSAIDNMFNRPTDNSIENILPEVPAP